MRQQSLFMYMIYQCVILCIVVYATAYDCCYIMYSLGVPQTTKLYIIYIMRLLYIILPTNHQHQLNLPKTIAEPH